MKVAKPTAPKLKLSAFVSLLFLGHDVRSLDVCFDDKSNRLFKKKKRGCQFHPSLPPSMRRMRHLVSQIHGKATNALRNFPSNVMMMILEREINAHA